MGAPLCDVPFCVLDIETTGGSPMSCGITEIGAVRYRGGALESAFHTMVNPGQEIPPFITVLTGITHAMVVEAPTIEQAFPSLLEFVGDAVVVGHNVRFDLSFLNVAAERLGYGRLSNRSIDTAALARRLVRSEVRNLKLSTLAGYFRSPVQPNHRALDDAKATAHVLWGLLERAGTLGVTHLEDLLALPTARGTPHYGKIRLTDALPRRPGVYLFRDRNGEIFYVGKAKNLRSRVRSYFYGDTRRTVAQMLRELDTIEHRVCETELEAAVAEVHLISTHRPRHNRRSKPSRAPHWVRLTKEPFPRLALARSPRPDGLAYLGPFRGRHGARLIVEALWDALPLRRCTGEPGSRDAPCALAQLGVALCPCDGTLSEPMYREVVDRLIAGVENDAALLLDPLVSKIEQLAAAGRFEEAAWVRDRHAALGRAIERRHVWRALNKAGTIRAEALDGGAVIEAGHLVAAWKPGSYPPFVTVSASADAAESPEVPPSLADAEEAHLIWQWLTSGEVHLLDITGRLALPASPVPELVRIDVPAA
jgi:DNA polymerase-3 subunit epsilon